MQDMLDFKGYPQGTLASEWRDEQLRAWPCEPCTVATLDKRKLEGFWRPPIQGHQGAVIVFHPNFAVALDMIRYGRWYSKHGFGVLLVTMGGYSGSEGDTSELTAYIDAHAALQHVHVQRGIPLKGITHHPHFGSIPAHIRGIRFIMADPDPDLGILCHGVSIGGALATAAAYLHPGVHCTVDQTFVNTREVAEELIGSQPDYWIRNIPTWLIRGFVETVFPHGVQDTNLPGITTDGMDNELKARSLKGGYFVISAQKDMMMPPTFATRLIEAYMEGSELGGDDAIVRYTCIERGGHGAFFGDNRRSEMVYVEYLRAIGLLSKEAYM